MAGNVPTDPVPPDRILVYPWVGVPLFEDVFEKAKNRGQIGSRFETTDSSTLLVDSTADGGLGSGSVRDTTRYTLTWRFP